MATGNADDVAPPTNYIDVKLHSITGLPPNWVVDSGTAPLYNDHPFRYEVDVSIAGNAQTFKGGRILQTVPAYSEFVDSAKLAAPSSGLTDDDDDDEQPSDVPSEATPPAVPKGEGAAATATAEETDASATAAAAENASTAVPTTTTATAPPAILWVLGPEHDTDLKEDLAARAKDAKAAPKKGAQPVVAPTATEAPKPLPAPSATGPPLCCLRFMLNLQQLTKFEEQVEASQPLTLTFRRVLRSSAPPEWEDTMEAKFQAHLNVSLKELAEPGALSIKNLAVPLEPAQVDAPKEEDKKAKKAAPKKAKGGGTAPGILTEEWDSSEPHPYVNNKTTAVISLSCQSAITRLPEGRPRPELQPSDMIPKRVKPPRRPVEATKVFSKEVEGLIHRIVRDYREHQANVGHAMSPEDSRVAFLQSLQTSGRTTVYKDQLVAPMQGIVRETFIRKPSPSAEEMDRVSNELYTYLLDHLHITLNRAVKAGRHEDTASGSAAASLIEADPVDRLKRLALEAEVMHEHQLSAQYHQERLVKCREAAAAASDELPDVWCEYAEYCLRVRDALKAEQGYREALAIDMAHLPSLIGYGSLLLSRNRFKESEVFLQSAIDIAGNSITWGFIALFYDAFLLSLPDSPEEDTRRTSCKRESKYALGQAVRILAKEREDQREAAAAAEREENPNEPPPAEEQQQQQECTPEQIYEMLAKHLLDLHQEELVNICLSKSKPSEDVDFLYAKLFSQTNQHEEAITILQQLSATQPQNGYIRLLLGDIYAQMQKTTDAEREYDQALRIDPHCGNGPSYVRLGNMYVALGKYKDALSAFLMGAKVWPCGLTWLGVGISYYRMDDLVRAEQALNESNILNNRNAKTWAYLALVCLRQRREDDGDQAFNQAIKADLSDPFLIAEIGSEQARLSRFKIAEACFRRSLNLQPDDCNTRMHLARVLANMRRMQEAREEFAMVARTSTNETQRMRAEEQLQQIPAVE